MPRSFSFGSIAEIESASAGLVPVGAIALHAAIGHERFVALFSSAALVARWIEKARKAGDVVVSARGEGVEVSGGGDFVWTVALI